MHCHHGEDGETWGEDEQTAKRVKLSLSLLSGVKSLWSDQALLDYTVRVEGGGEFRVHRVIMAAVSDFFRALLTGGLRESHTDSVELGGVTREGLEPILQHVYGESPQLQLSLDNVFDVVAAASQLQMALVLDSCVDFLAGSVDVDTCVDVLNLTLLYHLKHADVDLEQLALRCVLDNFEQLAREGELLNLSGDALKLVLSRGVFDRSELSLLRLVKDWLYAESPETTEWRLKEAAAILRNIRFALIPPKKLQSLAKEEEYPFLTTVPECAALLEEALAYHALPMHKQVLAAAAAAAAQTERTAVRDPPAVVALGGFHYSDVQLSPVRPAESMHAYHGGRWSKVEGFSMPPGTVLVQAAVVVVNNFLLVCGGMKDASSRVVTAKCHIFDPRIHRWGRISPMTVARANVALVYHDRHLYAFGGEERKVQYSDAVERYSFDADRWEVVARTERRLTEASCCVCRERIYLLGGKYRSANGKVKLAKEVAVFNPSTLDWADWPPLKTAQAGHTALLVQAHNPISPRPWSTEDCICVVSKNGQNIDTFYPNSCTWHRTKVCNRGPSSAAVVNLDNRLVFVNGWVADGGGRRKYGSCAVYDPTRSTFTCGSPINRGPVPIADYPEDVDRLYACVLAPNYHLLED